MATTAIIPLHGRKGKTAAQVLKDCINYITNPEKTGNGTYISTCDCEKETIVDEFMANKKLYKLLTNRKREKTKDVLGYMLRQSFLPGEITPEKANEIGRQLALSFTNGEHQFIVCTHIDKEHIHNHIIFNSTALDCTHKFNNEKNSFEILQKHSDRLCKENGLSVIENPKEKGKDYKEWQEEKKGTSWKAKLRNTIDKVLPDCNTYDDFLSAMKKSGYEMKQGKQLSFRAAGQERFTRLSRLGADYSETALKECICKKSSCLSNNKINLIIDIQSKLDMGKGKGYERWAKLFNLKEAAKTLAYLSENNIINFIVLENKAEEANKNFHAVSKQIKKLEAKMSDTAKLKTHIIHYLKTKDSYTGYQKSKQKESYRSLHEPELLLHENAKKYFNQLKLKKLPSISSLNADYNKLLEEKKTLYEDYKKLKAESQELQKVKQNVSEILKINQPEQNKTEEKKKEQGR